MSADSLRSSNLDSRSARDLRCIDVAARFLLAGIWLERKLGSTPKTSVALDAESGTSRPVTRLSRFALSPLSQMQGEE
jgi:hypothetical protein